MPVRSPGECRGPRSNVGGLVLSRLARIPSPTVPRRCLFEVQCRSFHSANPAGAGTTSTALPRSFSTSTCARAASASLALLRPSPSPAASPLRTSLPRRCLLGLLPRSPALSSGRDGTVEGWPDAAREINSLRRRAFLGHLKLDLADAV